MSADLIILRTLEVKLAEVAAASALPVAYQNVRFSPSEHAAYLATQLLFAKPDDSTLGDSKFYVQPGIFQVTVVSKSGDGLKQALEIAGEIKAAFSKGSVLHDADGVRLRIDETPAIRSARGDGDWQNLPIDIGYRADINPA